MDNKSRHKAVNRRERIGGFIYVLLFFIFGVGFGTWLLMSNNDLGRVFARKDLVEVKMRRQQEFRTAQEEGIKIGQLLVGKIAAYDPGVNALYEKSDIQLHIAELRRQYERNKADQRYFVFHQIGDFYQMWFNDRQYLWSLEQNLSSIKQNLEECELGLEAKKEELRGNK